MSNTSNINGFIRHCLAGAILLFAITAANGQDKNHFLGLKAGASIPLGTYGSNELPDGSFTQPGFNISAEGAWFFSKSFGIGGQVEYNVHTVDVQSLGAEKVENDPFLQDLTIRSDPFRLISGNIGFYYNHQLSPKFDLLGKLLVGMMYGITPYQLYKPEYFLVEPKWYEITSAKDWGGAILAGAQVKYHFNKYLGIYFDTYYNYSKMDFDFRVAGGNTRTETKHIMFIVTAIGVSFAL